MLIFDKEEEEVQKENKSVRTTYTIIMECKMSFPIILIPHLQRGQRYLKLSENDNTIHIHV